MLNEFYKTSPELDPDLMILLCLFRAGKTPVIFFIFYFSCIYRNWIIKDYSTKTNIPVGIRRGPIQVQCKHTGFGTIVSITTTKELDVLPFGYKILNY
jgi:hypothetical protein